MIKVCLQKTILHTPYTFSLEDEIVIAELVEQYLGDVSDHSCVVVNGNLIDPSEYGVSLLESGDHVSLSCIPQGLEVTTWLLIATMLSAAYAGYALSRIEAPDGESEQEKKDRIDGLRNGPKKYEPVPVVLGKYRVAPDWLAEPYVENVGDNQYYNLILCGGYAPQKLEDFRIGDTPIREYEDVQIWYTGEYGGSSTQSGVQRFASSENSDLYRRWPNDVSQENVAVELEYDNVVTRTSAAGVSEIRLDFSYPSGLIKRGSQEKYKYDARSHLRVDLTDTSTNVTSRVAKVVTFNSNSNVRYTANTGDIYRDSVTGTYHLAYFGIGGNGAVNSSNGQFNPRGVDIIGLNVDLPGLNYRYTTEVPASQITFYDSSNRFIGVNTDWTDFAKNHIFCTVVRQTLDEFFESLKIDVGEQSTYNLAVSVRRPPTIDEDKLIDTVRWDYTTSLRPMTQDDFLNLIGSQKPPVSIDGTLRKTFYPVVVIVRIRASNQLSGMLDKFNYLATSVVPSDWNSDWRNWKARALKETENPAELYRWICQGPMNANALRNDKLHLSSLDSWRTLCNNEGFKTGGYLNESSTMITELNKIGYTGRAEFSFIDGKYGVAVQERKNLPVQVFTPKNSWDFSSSRQFPEDTDGLKFEFTNAQADYEQDEGYYNDPTKNPVDARGLYDSVDIPYVTDSNIITKHARFEFFKKVLQREAYTLTTDVEGLRCTRGDLVLIQNDVIDVGLGSGRIVDVDESGGFGNRRIQIDETIGLVTGQNYGLSLRDSNGNIQTITSVYEDGYFNVGVIFLEQEDLVSYGQPGVETLPCVVKEVDYDNDNNVTLTLVNYSEDLFDIDEENPPEYQSNITPRLSYKRPARPVITLPSNAADFADGRATIKIKSSQTQESNVRWYSLEARSSVVAEGGGESQLSSRWEVIDIVQADKGRVEVDLGLDNYWEFRARSLSENNLYSGYSQVVSLTVPTGPSQDLTSITLQELVNTPKSPTASLSTIVVRVGLPNDPQFAYGRVQYRVVGQFTYVDAGRVGALYGDRVDIVVPSDGTIYEVVVSSVSITGVESASELSETIQVYDVENDELAPEIQIPDVRGLEIFDQGNDTEFVGRDVEFNWRQTSINEWLPIGNEPGRGVDYGDLDEYFRDYEVKVFDTSNNLLSRHYREDNTFTYTYEQNRQDYAKLNGEEGANRTFRVEVRMRGHNNQLSLKPAKLTVSNPAPNLPVLFPSVGFTHASFNYTAPEDRDFVGIKLWLSTQQGFTPSDNNLEHPLGADTSISVDGLSTGTSYYVKYQAFDAFGEGPVSDEFSFNTNKINSVDLDEEPPTVPENIVLTSGVEESSLSTKSWVNASWDASTDDGIVAGYFVSYYTDVNPDAVEVFTGSLSYRITDATPGRTYYVKVSAQDWAGNTSDYSSEISITADGDTDAPAVPTGITATGGLDKIILKWTNPSDDDFLATRLHRGTTSGFTPTSGNLITTQPGRKGEVVEVVDAEVTNNTQYFYKLIAVDVTGNTSGITASVSATPNSITSLNIANYFAEAAIGNAFIANLDAGKITAGTIDADRIGAKTITSGLIDVDELSALSADLGTIIAGTITGAIVRTAASGARVELTSASGIRGFNSSSEVTFQLNTNGSGSIGRTNTISWDTAGTITVPGTLIGGEIVGNVIKTSETGWRAELADSEFPIRYWDGTTTKFSLDDAGNAVFAGELSAATGTFSGELSAASGSFTGAVTISSGSGYDNLTDKPTSLSGINSGEGSKLESVESGADVTGEHVSADTAKVAGTVASEIRSGSRNGFGNSFEAGEFEEWVANGNSTITASPDAFDGVQAALITHSGSGTPNSTGSIGAASVEIPKTIGRAFGGHRIMVTVHAKQPSSNASSEFAVAYSTNDTGNSGWQYFEPTNSYKPYTFFYNVPEPNSGSLDYLGIWGDTSNLGLGVLIDRVSIAVLQLNSDIDALQTQNGPSEAGAEKTSGKSLTVLTDRSADNISESGSRKWAGESGATVGANFNTTLSNIPNRITNSATTGLNLTDTHLGYYDGNAWRTYIQNNGNFHFGGTGNNFIDWNGSDLVLAVDRLGSGASNAGANSVALGSSSSAGGDNSVALGSFSNASANSSTAVGRLSSATATWATSVGVGSKADFLASTSIGESAEAMGTNSVSVGRSSKADASGVALGVGSEAKVDGVSSGRSSYSHQNSVSIGVSAGVEYEYTGSGSSTTGQLSGSRSVSIGRRACASGSTSIAIGADYAGFRYTIARNSFSCALGAGAQSTHFASTAIGFSSATTAANQIRLGTSSETVSIPGNLEVSGYIEQTSDETLKTNWRNLPDSFIENVAGVKSGIYDRTDKEMTQAGVSAQSWKEVLPQAVGETPDGLLSLDYGASALVTAIELAKEIQNLKAEIAKLKGDK